MDRGPHGRRLSTKKLLFRLISFIGEATWPSIMQNVYGEKVVVYITFYFFIFLRPFTTLSLFPGLTAHHLVLATHCSVLLI